jgi:SAM-dependent methyltransferase
VTTRALATLPLRAVRRSRRAARTLREWLATRPYRRQTDALADGTTPAYRAYLRTQLDRSLGKRANDPGVGQRILVEAAVAAGEPGARVLCVGCRNGRELDAFRAHGLADVRGIDIFSQRADIEVMDMHAMTFADDTFDVVYSSHSLEHAHDVALVARELVRVARPGGVLAVEVPVRHRGSAADLVVFSGLDELLARFSGSLTSPTLAEEVPARTERNDQGSAVARFVAPVVKPARAD